jgi:hypothetical protein
MPVLLKACFFARRDDFELHGNRSLTRAALSPNNARMNAGMAG